MQVPNTSFAATAIARNTTSSASALEYSLSSSNSPTDKTATDLDRAPLAINQNSEDKKVATSSSEDKVVISDEGRSKSFADSQAKADKLSVSESEKEAVLRELAARDLEVRVHEQAHASVGGELAGAASYSFKQGPDGARYAVSGEVSIDVSDVPGDPQATLEKMSRVRRAALAPAEPSSQDRQVAGMATQKMTEAQAQITAEQRDALQADAKQRDEQRTKFRDELEQASKQESGLNTSQDLADESAFVSVADQFAEYNTRLRQINETLLRISAPEIPSSGSMFDEIA